MPGKYTSVRLNIPTFAPMSSIRQQRVAKEVQKELAEFFRVNAASIVGAVMVSVTAVRITPDLKIAKVYLSFFPAKEKKALLEKIKEAAKFIRGEIGKKLRHQLRYIPELHFYLDDSLDEAERIEQLLKE
jgi:ribosome-binding factor A